MPLDLAHKKLDVFKVSKALLLPCFKETISFPPEEKSGMTSQIRSTALSVHLNLAEGCSGKSLKERIRFYETAPGSIIEIDAALDIAVEPGDRTLQKLELLGSFMMRGFQIISKMIS